MAETVEIERKEIKGFSVPYFYVETKKRSEAIVYCCLGCGSVYGGLLIDPYWPLTKTIHGHHTHAGKLDPACKKSLFLKIDWDLVEEKKREREAAEKMASQSSTGANANQKTTRAARPQRR